MLRHHTQRIYITSRSVDAESVGTECKDFPSGGVGSSLRKASSQRDIADEFLHEGSNASENNLPTS